MLVHATLEKMQMMKLSAMAEAFEAQRRSSEYTELSFEERLGLLNPAFVGLGAPYWDPEARGTLTGLTHGTGRAHVVRAVLEAACYQTRDVVEAMQADAGTPLSELRVDGGMARNDYFLQLQADLLGIPVARTAITETTALGAAYLAGLATGLFESTEALAAGWRPERRFEAAISQDRRDALYAGWKQAVARARLRALELQAGHL